MKSRKVKKILSCALATMMAAGVLSGCGSQATGNVEETSQATAPTGTTEESAAAEEITFPLKEQVELTIATEDGTVASLANNLPLWEEIEKRTNIKINWDVTAPAQYVEVMKLRVSAGGELPDVMLLPNGVNLGELGSDGRIVPLEGYIDKYGDNINAMYEEYVKNPEITKKRMFYETMEDVLPGMKIVIDNGDGVQKVLPLDSFTGNSSENPTETLNTDPAQDTQDLNDSENE